MRTNHEEDLRLWNDVPANGAQSKRSLKMNPIPVQTKQENDNESDEKDEEYKVDPLWEGWYKQKYQRKPTNLQAASGKLAKEERDDEQEFTRIPIAGEDSEDYNTSDDDELEEEEDEDNLALILPLVEPLQEPATLNSPSFEDEFGFPEELAFLIGHKDGIVRGHELTPIPIHNNKFGDLPTIDDKVLFCNNMQAMQRIDHKRKISKEERRLDEEAQDFELLLFSDTTVFPPSPPSSPVPDHKQRCQTKRPKNTRLTSPLSSVIRACISPISVSLSVLPPPLKHPSIV